MIDRALELKEPLTYINQITTKNEYKNNWLDEADWIALKEMKKLLGLLLEPSIRLQSEHYININKGFLFIYLIYSNYQRYINSYNYHISQQHQLVSSSITYYYSGYIYTNSI